MVDFRKRETVTFSGKGSTLFIEVDRVSPAMARRVDRFVRPAAHMPPPILRVESSQTIRLQRLLTLLSEQDYPPDGSSSLTIVKIAASRRRSGGSAKTYWHQDQLRDRASDRVRHLMTCARPMRRKPAFLPRQGSEHRAIADGRRAHSPAQIRKFLAFPWRCEGLAESCLFACTLSPYFCHEST